MTINQYDLLVIGAGITGLVTTYECLKNGIHNVKLVDKSKSVGGRLATRRIGRNIADHGAQYFTIKSRSFEMFIKNIIPSSMFLRWPIDEINTESTRISTILKSEEKYAIKGGINQLAKYIAKYIQETIAIDLNITINSLKRKEINNDLIWEVESTNKKIYYAKRVILTPPVPQSIEIIRNGGVSIPSKDQEILENIKYARCLCGMVLLNNKVSTLKADIVTNPTQNITLIADNYRKDSSNGHILTIHTTPEFSERYWDNNDALSTILNELKSYLGPIEITDAQLKKWRYAKPLFIHSESLHLFSDEKPMLIICGDGFGGARVEGAYISGKSTAEFLINLEKRLC